MRGGLGCRVHTQYTELHGNDDDVTSNPCLITHYKLSLYCWAAGTKATAAYTDVSNRGQQVSMSMYMHTCTQEECPHCTCTMCTFTYSAVRPL